jgi:hypothetical protein
MRCKVPVLALPLASQVHSRSPDAFQKSAIFVDSPATFSENQKLAVFVLGNLWQSPATRELLPNLNFAESLDPRGLQLRSLCSCSVFLGRAVGAAPEGSERLVSGRPESPQRPFNKAARRDCVSVFRRHNLGYDR